jgi:hypothetical protein
MVLPDPPADYGSFLLVTGFGRESNRFLQIMEAARYAVFTERRLLYFPYDGTDVARMYDLEEIDRSMRALRVHLGRPPLVRNDDFPHMLSYDRYLHDVLRIPVPDAIGLTDTHRDHCYAVRRIHCSNMELDTKQCARYSDACHFSHIPFRDEPLTRLGPPEPLSASASVALKDDREARERAEAKHALEQLQSWTNEKLLVLSGALLWNMPFPFRDTNLFPNEDTRRRLDQLFPNLHPQLIERASRALQSLTPASASAASSSPSLALHIRTGDLRDAMRSVGERMKLALELVQERWQLDPTSTRVYIATDSDRAEELDEMRRAFPGAQIGLAGTAHAALPREPAVFTVLLDKAVCVQADYFIGSMGSSYSMVIGMLIKRQKGYNYRHDTLL